MRHPQYPILEKCDPKYHTICYIYGPPGPADSLTLIWVGGCNPPYWFSLNSSKTVKAETQAFCNIQ